MTTPVQELKRKEEAEACFRQVVSMRPTCALSLGNLAGVYYEQGKLEQAIATYREAITHEPQFPEAYNNLGNALRWFALAGCLAADMKQCTSKGTLWLHAKSAVLQKTAAEDRRA